MKNGFLMTIAALILSIFATAGARASDWDKFKSAHLQADGAVVDDHSGIVHSEGQSYAMLLAVRNGDQEAFDRVWTFAKMKMRRPDGLFAWKIENGKITDTNNASDAEIVMAWSLLQAGRRWAGPYLSEAMPIIAAVRTRLVVERPDPLNAAKPLLLLLPGIDGFQDGDELRLNPSYWVFPAFDDFADVDDPAFWESLSRSGERLISLAAERSAGLTPDWISFPRLGPAKGLSFRASYDALRVPLWLIWSGRSSPTFDAWRRLWRGQAKAWSDPSTGEISAYAPGIEQISVLALLDRAASSPEGQLDRLPAIGLKTPYYGSAIVQLVSQAWMERFPQ